MRPQLALVLVAALVAASRSTADDYKLDTSHTSLIFGVKHMEFSYTYGRFNKVEGTYVLDADPAKCSFALLVDASSIDTNDAKRDEHLRGPDFFNAGQFPVIMFKSTKVELGADPSIYNVTGDLTLHGVTKPVTLELKKLGEGKGMTGDFRTGFITQSKLNRSEFDMKGYIPGIGDEVAITISFEGIRQGEATGAVRPPSKVRAVQAPAKAAPAAAVASNPAAAR